LKQYGGPIQKGSGGERASDGAFSPRDHEHMVDGEHDSAFDHEAILGSTKDAEEFDQLPPEEAKKRLKILVDKMDSDSDGFVDKSEMNGWILKSFASLSKEESEERFEDNDEDGDGIISWDEYKRGEFDMDDDEDFKNVAGDPDKAEELAMMEEDHILFQAADKDADGKLTKSEFLSFTHPEEDAEMIRPVLAMTKRAKDLNNDGKVDFQEYVGERGKDQTKEWLMEEKERFDDDLDKDKDGSLNDAEIIAWVIPDNNEVATDEVNHLFAGADEDVDGLLAASEIIKNHDLFVGSEATDYGEHLNNPHRLDDEL
jgi:Ca2+-binding EF-hand superfamily protein